MAAHGNGFSLQASESFHCGEVNLANLGTFDIVRLFKSDGGLFSRCNEREAEQLGAGWGQ